MAERLPVLYNKKPCYDIVFCKGFEDFEQELKNLECVEKKICIVTDSTVANLYADAVEEVTGKACKKVVRFVFEAGEASKNLEVVKKLYTFLIEEGFDRKDMLIALGGGVVGDLTGYAAATYLRGIDFIQVPTTLLAQCDSSIGGKTGVDFDGYKNMVGAFKMPRLVYMNLQVLATLDERQFYSGFAEVMKYGLIKDHIFYEWLIENMYEICERDMDTLLEMVMRSCTVKKMVVEKDPTEQGERALLNLGHTIGHAIEKAKNFELLHGECVALGTVAAAYISWKKEMLSMDEYYEIRDMFVPFYLPISVENIVPEEILKLTKSDKKMQNGRIKFILLKKIGKAVIDTTVTDEEMLDAIREIHFDESDWDK
ncbi:MAG: 3-dehydroquinate synthase [Acetatifactor sp.]|nr:3-dehydroquinate synthase [Acetatifactor sp.]